MRLFRYETKKSRLLEKQTELMKKMYFCLLKNKSKNGHQELQQAIANYFATQPVLKAWLFGSIDGGLLPFARESTERDKILIYERTA